MNYEDKEGLESIQYAVNSQYMRENPQLVEIIARTINNYMAQQERQKEADNDPEERLKVLRYLSKTRTDAGRFMR